MAKYISALAVVTALLGFSGLVGAGKLQPKEPNPQEKKAERKGPQSRAEVLAILETPLDLQVLRQQGEITLEEFLGALYDEVLNQKGALPILVDVDAFKEEFPDAGDVNQSKVKLPRFPTKMTVATVLRLALSKIPTNNATYKVFRDHIEVTTISRASMEELLRFPILASFKDKPLSQIIHELSETTAAPIVIDERVGAQKDKKVSAAFYNDVSLQGAMRVLTEQTGLSFVNMNSILVITTPERAGQLAEEKKQFIKDKIQILKMLNEIPPGADRGTFDFMDYDQQMRWWTPAPPSFNAGKKKVEAV